MSQTPEDIARAAALDIEMPLGEIVYRFPVAAVALEGIRLNYWSRGKRRLSVACRDQGLDPEQVLALLRQQIAMPGAEVAKDWTKVSLADMVKHVVSHYHKNERRELGRIENLIKVVVDEYRNTLPQLRLLYEEFLEVRKGDSEHMDLEESLLFPLMEQVHDALVQEKLPAMFSAGSVAGPIRRTEYEHDLSSIYFKRLRDATESYRLPEEATENLKSLYQSLMDLEANIHKHVHFENWVLHPAALKAEAKLLSLY